MWCVSPSHSTKGGGGAVVTYHNNAQNASWMQRTEAFRYHVSRQETDGSRVTEKQGKMNAHLLSTVVQHRVQFIFTQVTGLRLLLGRRSSLGTEVCLGRVHLIDDCMYSTQKTKKGVRGGVVMRRRRKRTTSVPRQS